MSWPACGSAAGFAAAGVCFLAGRGAVAFGLGFGFAADFFAVVGAGGLAAGFAEVDVKQIQHLLYISEYKRFQSAPGTRLSKKAFWLDRRYPIVNRWRDGG